MHEKEERIWHLGFEKHLKKLHPTSIIFLNPSCFLWGSKLHHLNVTEGWEYLEPQGNPTSVVELAKDLHPPPFRKVFIAKLFCFSPSLVSWMLSLLYLSSFYFFTSPVSRTVSVPATASPFQMAWLSFPQHYFLTLFPVCSLLSRGLG